MPSGTICEPLTWSCSRELGHEAAEHGHAAATQLLLRHAFCLQEGGKLSCPGIKHADAKRTLSHLLQEAERNGAAAR